LVRLNVPVPGIKESVSEGLKYLAKIGNPSWFNTKFLLSALLPFNASYCKSDSSSIAGPYAWSGATLIKSNPELITSL